MLSYELRIWLLLRCHMYITGFLVHNNPNNNLLFIMLLWLLTQASESCKGEGA